MKFSAFLFIALSTSSSAFTTPASKMSSATLLRLSETTPETMDEIPEIVEIPEVPKVSLPAMSQSLPFMPRPAVLDGTMVGDVGFDPLGFAKTKADLLNYREAEIKHARLAMLAAAGWPISELFDKNIANFLGLAPVVGSDDRAPSLLNGGLEKISPFYWVTCLLAAAAIDFYGIQKSKSGNADYFPGNLGFDPFGLYPKDKEGQERMQLAELKNGRLGMIAITAFAAQEFANKAGVVDSTSIFFRPIWTVMKEYANSGYYLPN
jgi:Chlorophyll A-B binding protein